MGCGGNRRPAANSQRQARAHGASEFAEREREVSRPRNSNSYVGGDACATRSVRTSRTLAAQICFAGPRRRRMLNWRPIRSIQAVALPIRCDVQLEECCETRARYAHIGCEHKRNLAKVVQGFLAKQSHQADQETALAGFSFCREADRSSAPRQCVQYGNDPIRLR